MTTRSGRTVWAAVARVLAIAIGACGGEAGQIAVHLDPDPVWIEEVP